MKHATVPLACTPDSLYIIPTTQVYLGSASELCTCILLQDDTSLDQGGECSSYHTVLLHKFLHANLYHMQVEVKMLAIIMLQNITLAADSVPCYALGLMIPEFHNF